MKDHQIWTYIRLTNYITHINFFNTYLVLNVLQLNNGLKTKNDFRLAARNICPPDKIIISNQYAVSMSIKIGSNVMIADTAILIGNVEIQDGVAIFDHSVLRGDLNKITIGNDSNVQDNVTIHVERDNPTVIGRSVSIGHNAVVHGSRIEDEVIIGMGAIILNGSHIRRGSVVAAGAVVTENFESDECSLIAGVPAKVKKTDDALLEYAVTNGLSYQVLRDDYLKGKYERVSGKNLRQ